MQDLKGFKQDFFTIYQNKRESLFENQAYFLSHKKALNLKLLISIHFE